MSDSSIRLEFLADHTRLEEALSGLLDAADGASADELIRVYRAFEADLRAHMEFEEKSMFPVIDDRDELERLHDDHATIRGSLDELGLAVELHAVRKDSIEKFVEQMRAHASREDACLYAIADERLDPTTQSSVLKRLAAHVAQRLEGGA